MREKLLKTIQDSRLYTLTVAEALPEAHYDAVLANGTWTFGELLNHMAYGIRWWNDNFVKGAAADWNPPTPKPSKDDVIASLADAYEALTQTVAGADVNDGVTMGVWATLDHITHHRGQAVLHLRQHGLVPPEYVGVG